MTSYGCQECWLKDIDNFWLQYDTWTWLLSPSPTSQGRYLLYSVNMSQEDMVMVMMTLTVERDGQSVGPPTNKKPHLQ